MWTDTYCYIQQCGAAGGGPQVGAPLFPPSQDAAFEQSVGGMMFPRGFVGAAALWNYNSSIDTQAPDFVAALWDLNDRIIAGGGASCPSRCHCDQLSACGVPYIPPTPPPTPAAGSPLGLLACEGAFSANQVFTFTAAGKLQLASNSALCAQDPGAGLYPLTLGPCSTGATFTVNAAQRWIVAASGDCMDVNVVGQTVGTWACGANGQPNQEWVLKPQAATTIQSVLYNTCLTAL